MDWYDVLIKIGVGACLGFGIIVLAKLGRKRIEQDRSAAGQLSPERNGASGTTGDRGTEP
jgi:hypothetical protein